MRNITIKTLFGAVLSLLVTFGLTHSAAAQTAAARIAFSAPVTVRKMHETYEQIFSMNSFGSDVAQLTSASANSYYPAWSPGQRYIAFVRGGILYVMEASGEANGGRTFTVGPATGSGADWSPDGSMIVFVGTSDMGNGLWTVGVNADTGEVGTPTRVSEGYCSTPSWSPDGSKIAFAFLDPPGPMVKVLDLTTGAEFSIDSVYCNTPSWNPDGSRIAFMSVAPFTTTKGHTTTTTWYYEIFTANADGSAITQVTSLQTDLVGFPKWSDDATEVAFRNKVSGTDWIYKVTLATGAVTSLSKGDTLDWAP